MKACDELLEIIKQPDEKQTSPEDIITPLLVAWPRYYQKSAIDPEPRVRSQSHHVTIEVIKLAGKSSAPYLKTLIPPLLFGTVDEYSISGTCLKNFDFKIVSKCIVFIVFRQ